MEDRRVPIYTLLPFKSILRQLASFNENVEKLNFTYITGTINRKWYADQHEVAEYSPNISAHDVLDIRSLKQCDRVILTLEQYADYRRFSTV